MKDMRRFAGNVAMALTASASVFFAAGFVLRHLASTPPPVQLIANPGDGKVTLEWTNGAAYTREYDGMQWEYQQYQRKRDGDVNRNWNEIAGTDAAKGRHRIDIKNLTNSWTYVFRVRATNEKSHGTPSNEAIATPEAVPALDPATKEQLARIEEHLAGLLASTNRLDLSTLETRLTEIRDALRQPSSPAGTGRATLLPVHLLLHFGNAQLSDPSGGLSGPGVVLEPLHERMLGATVNTLRECAGQESPVSIRPYGFASSTPFAGRDDTDDLNVMAANRRARAVYEALNRRLRGEYMSVEEPPKWDTFEEMIKKRNECIESPSGERVRDPFLDRVVVLELQTPGRCAPADWTARSIRCSGSAGGDQ